MTGMRQKASIIAIGMAQPHEPDNLGRAWTVADWVMEGGDFPAVDVTNSLLGGWTSPELALLASVARNCGDDAALDVAEACRTVPPKRPQITFTHSGMGVCNKGRVHVPPCDFGTGI